MNCNFLDKCVLEWCKLFGDSRAMHYYGKVLTDPTAFFNGLLKNLGMTEAEFDAYVREMKAYRDEFVAHLDSAEVMHPPRLTVAQKSVSYLYDYLRAHEDEGVFFLEDPSNASTYYARSSREAKAVYDG